MGGRSRKKKEKLSTDFSWHCRLSLKQVKHFIENATNEGRSVFKEARRKSGLQDEWLTSQWNSRGSMSTTYRRHCQSSFSEIIESHINSFIIKNIQLYTREFLFFVNNSTIGVHFTGNLISSFLEPTWYEMWNGNQMSEQRMRRPSRPNERPCREAHTCCEAAISIVTRHPQSIPKCLIIAG